MEKKKAFGNAKVIFGNAKQRKKNTYKQKA